MWLRRGVVVAYNAKLADKVSSFGSKLVAGYPTTQNWSLAIAVLRDQPDMAFRILGLSWDYRRNFDRNRLELFTNGEYGYPFFDQVDYSIKAEAGARSNSSKPLVRSEA